MILQFRKLGLCSLFLVFFLSGIPAGAGANENPDGSGIPFGFLGPLIYKFDQGIRYLRLGDLDGDGDTDIALVNNRRARIEFLLQLAEGEEVEPEPDTSARANILFDDTRFRKRTHLTEQEIFGFVLRDLNGNGRTDMAYYGKPKALTVFYRDEKGQFGERKRLNADEGADTPDNLAVGDLNSDGRPDLLLLGDKCLLLYLQGDDSSFREPIKIPADTDGISFIDIRDLNGNGRDDLILMNPADREPLRLRYQNEMGGLGPEIRLRLSPIRFLRLDDLDRDGQMDFLIIQQQSGRFGLFKMEEQESENGNLGPVTRYSFESVDEARRRAFALGILRGEGKTDLLVSNPGSGSISLFLQQPGGGFDAGTSYPAPLDVRFIEIADLDGDSKNEIYVLSVQEGTVGVSHFENGHLTFPRSLEMPARPLCMTVADLTGDGTPELVALGKSGNRAVLWTYGATRSATRELPFREFKEEPTALRVFDANQDGRADLMFLARFQPVRFLLQKEDGTFEDLAENNSYTETALRDLDIGRLTMADMTGNGIEEMLISRGNFVRVARINEKGAVESVDQYNGWAPNSEILGSTVADLTGDGTPEVILLDRQTGGRLTILSQDLGGHYRILENRDCSVSRFMGMTTAELNGDGHPDLILFTEQGFLVLESGVPVPDLKEIAGYETDVKDGRYDSLAAGDLNGDGMREVVLVESSKNALEILAFDREEIRFRSRYRFETFEQLLTRYDSRGGNEPREIIVGDVTGDGLEDMVVILHDRVIVYPQDEMP